MPLDPSQRRMIYRVPASFDDLEGGEDEMIRLAQRGHTFCAEDGLSASLDGHSLAKRPCVYRE